MVKQIKIFWQYSYGGSHFYFDIYRDWIVIVTKDYNHSRLVDLKKLLRTRAFRAFTL